MRGTRGLIVALVTIQWISPALAAAEALASLPPQGTTQAFFGSYHQTVPIAVPAYHGIEPKLALSYDSSARDGYLGVGWRLDGWSVIERGQPNHGAPRYDPSDTYFLDGQELIKCPAGTKSPGCRYGGNYAAQIETYERIQNDAANNQWTVTQPNGTRLVYVPIFVTPSGTFRWGVQKVIDTHGNTVVYQWGVNQFSCCWDYPDSITYNGTLIRLYWEQRPDVELSAIGVGQERISGRLKTIDVKTSDARVRTYTLSYQVSATTARSVLASVQQFGRDATIDASGAVSGGTALPAMIFTTDDQTAPSLAPADTGNGWGDLASVVAGFTPTVWAGTPDWMGIDTNNIVVTGDFNGDKKTDIAWTRGGWGGWQMRLSQAQGGFVSTLWPTPGNGLGADAFNYILTGDFNGDGKTDIAVSRPDWGAWVIYFARAGDFFEVETWTKPAGMQYDAFNFIVTGDFNGDGKTDIAWTRPGWRGWMMQLSRASVGCDTAVWGGDSDSGLVADKYNIIRTGNFNGDDKTDIAVTRPGWNGFHMALSQAGGGFLSATWGTDADGLGVDISNTSCTTNYPPVSFSGQVTIPDWTCDRPRNCPGWYHRQRTWPGKVTQVLGLGNQLLIYGGHDTPWAGANTHTDDLIGALAVSGTTAAGAVSIVAPLTYLSPPSYLGLPNRSPANPANTWLFFTDPDPFWKNADPLSYFSGITFAQATVTGPTSINTPVHTITGAGNTVTFSPGATYTFQGLPQTTCTTTTTDASNYVLVGDFNGDGLTDFAMTRPGWEGWRMRLARIGGGFTSAFWPAPQGIGFDHDNIFLAGDFNGDGKTDIAWGRTGWGAWFVDVAQNGGGFAPQWWGTAANGLVDDPYNLLVTGDFDGDGKTDIAYTRPTWNAWRLDLANLVGGGDAASPWLDADLNGDGKSDLVRPYIWAADGHAPYPHLHLQAGLATGDGNYGAPPPYGNGWGFVAGSWHAVDLNGDGRMDLALPFWTPPDSNIPYEHLAVLVALSNGDGSFTPTGWTSGWGNVGSLDWLDGDFNGDGKTDFALPHMRPADVHAPGEHLHVLVALSRGDGSFEQKEYANDWTNVGGRAQVADVDGDGKADLVWQYWAPADADAPYEHFRVRVALSQGDGQFVATSYANGWGNVGGTVRVGDVNGDGKSDLVLPYWSAADAHSRDEHLHALVALSNGSGGQFTPVFYANGWSSVGGRIELYDQNGDGRADLVLPYWGGPDAVAGYDHFHARIALSQGDGTFSAFEYENGWGNVGQAWRPADANGDRKPDLVQPHLRPPDGHSPAWHVHVLTAFATGGTDLLTAVKNGLGSTTSIGYAFSSAWANANNPPIVPTVTQLATDDGRGTVSMTTYSYAQGLYDALGRRFLGFRYARAVEPGGAIRETWFNQGYGSASKPAEIHLGSPDGKLLTKTTFGYVSNDATAPYTSVEAERWDIDFDDSGLGCPAWHWPAGPSDGPCDRGRRIHTLRGYNDDGAVTVELFEGDKDLTGDEKSVFHNYVPNTSAYIIDRPAAVTTYDTLTPSNATFLGQTLYHYDRATDWNVAPSAGDQTEIRRWLSTTGAFVASRTEYDNYGNVTAQIDEASARTSFAIDHTYQIFVTDVTNAASQSTHIDTDPVCGLPVRTVDANGQATTVSYDALCRLARTDGPGGSFEVRRYANLGDPTQQLLEVATPSANGAGSCANPTLAACQWTQTVFDGLGRPFARIDKGANTPIVTVTSYDQRGLVASETLPFLAGDQDLYWQSYQYDTRGRLVRFEHPDHTAVTTSYTPTTRTVTDEMGHTQSKVVDAWGRTTQHTETVDGVAQTLRYGYDARGNPTTIDDPVGNHWSFTFDSLGRKVASSDPDAGRRIWEWDDRGLLTASTDAKGQRTELSYDALGRLRVKTTLARTPSASSARWDYDEARAGFANLGRLTSTHDALGSAVIDYDAAGRRAQLTRKIDAASYTLHYGYDAGGRLVSLGYPEQTVRYVYDGAARVSAIPGIVTAATYDAAGRLGTQNNDNQTVTERTYSPERGWLNTITTSVAGTRKQDLSYSRDAEGRLWHVASPFAGEDFRYEYDDGHRLTKATSTTDPSKSQSLTYDALGNILNNSLVGDYTYPTGGAARPHGVISAGGGLVSYDANGNVLSSGDRLLSYDGENRVVAIDDIQIRYDGDGNRLARMQGADVTHYMGDEYQVRNGVATWTVSLSGLPVAECTQAGTRWLHADHLGTVQVVTDRDGSVVERDHQRAFRAPLDTEVSGETVIDSGDDDHGLLYQHARYYDPLLGRFLSPDPAPDASHLAGLNAYAYASNDPINRIDPSGAGDYSLGNGDLGGEALGGYGGGVDYGAATFGGGYQYPNLNVPGALGGGGDFQLPGMASSFLPPVDSFNGNGVIGGAWYPSIQNSPISSGSFQLALQVVNLRGATAQDRARLGAQAAAIGNAYDNYIAAYNWGAAVYSSIAVFSLDPYLDIIANMAFAPAREAERNYQSLGNQFALDVAATGRRGAGGIIVASPRAPAPYQPQVLWSAPTPTLTLPPVVNRSVTVGGPGLRTSNGSSLPTAGSPSGGVQLRYAASASQIVPRGAPGRVEGPQAVTRPTGSLRLQYTPPVSGAFPFRLRTNNLASATQLDRRMYLGYLANLAAGLGVYPGSLPTNLAGLSDSQLDQAIAQLQSALRNGGQSYQSLTGFVQQQLGGSARAGRPVVDRRYGVLAPRSTLALMPGVTTLDTRSGKILVLPILDIRGKPYWAAFREQQFVSNYPGSLDGIPRVGDDVFAALGGSGTRAVTAARLSSVFPGAQSLASLQQLYDNQAEVSQSQLFAQLLDVSVRTVPAFFGPPGAAVALALNLALDLSNGDGRATAVDGAMGVLFFLPGTRGVALAVKLAAAGVVFADGGTRVYTGLGEGSLATAGVGLLELLSILPVLSKLNAARGGLPATPEALVEGLAAEAGAPASLDDMGGVLRAYANSIGIPMTTDLGQWFARNLMNGPRPSTPLPTLTAAEQTELQHAVDVLTNRRQNAAAAILRGDYNTALRELSLIDTNLTRSIQLDIDRSLQFVKDNGLNATREQLLSRWPRAQPPDATGQITAVFFGLAPNSPQQEQLVLALTAFEEVSHVLQKVRIKFFGDPFISAGSPPVSAFNAYPAGVDVKEAVEADVFRDMAARGLFPTFDDVLLWVDNHPDRYGMVFQFLQQPQGGPR
jgi:RHS repeat-associated protein